LEEVLEDTKGVIRNRKPKKDRQHNGQTKKNKRTSNDLQNTTPKTKDRATRILLKTRDEFRCSGRISGFCSTSDTLRVAVKRYDHGLVYSHFELL